jgi:hypothetical protein
MGPEIRAGERPLLAFVCGVMRPEVQWARDVAVEALTKSPILVPWAFEYAPASSEPAQASYLSKVREADVVIWLVGKTTTSPVRDEIAEALAANRRIWAILLPAEERDEATMQLLRDVRARAKTAAAGNAEELRELLALTLSDEIVRALRDTPGLTRLALLEEAGRRSRARMVSRWVAVGLSTAEAISFADEPSIGSPPPDLLPDDGRPLSILVADIGAGKSVVAERAFQLALLEAREHAGAPIPLFLHMRDTRDGLEAAIRRGANGLGDVRLQGGHVVVDGADEVTPNLAARGIEEARVLTQTLPRTRILITSRPTAALRRGVPELVELPPSTAEEARALVGRISGYEITPGHEAGWPHSVRDAVRLPLFAILMGLNRRAGRMEPQTTGELLGALVEGAVEPVDGNALPVLHKLSVLVTDKGAPVDRAELGDAAARATASAARIVREEQGTVDFTLPLLAQWFAADALIGGDQAVAELVASRPRLDRWRYALAIALATGPRQFVDDAMTALVSGEPGFAAEIVEESFQRWGRRDHPVPDERSTDQIGRSLRTTIRIWGDAVQPLGSVVLPQDAAGNLAPLGVRIDGDYLTYGWYRGADEVPHVSELPAGIDVFVPHREWALRRSGVWSDDKGWTWRWGLELIRGDLKRKLETMSLRTDDEALLNEAIWLVALEAAGRRGSLSHDPIPIQTIERGLASIDESKPLIRLSDRYAHTDQVLARVRELRASWATEVSPPWPGPDERHGRPGPWIWDPYTPEQQRRRVEAVYAAALRAYAGLVEEWFPRLKERMRMAATLPATLHGNVTPATPTPAGVKPLQHMDTPTLKWYLDPLPLGAQSEVDIMLDAGEVDASSRDSDDLRARLERRQQKLIQLRPDSVGWISTFEIHGIADVFQTAPLAPLVYDWLKGDLAAIKWQ